MIGDVRRFPTSRHLVGYLGLHPTIRQSGNGPARHGRVSKEGSAAARHVLVEAAWSAAKSPGPLRAFAQRTAARRGRHVATVAVARKLAVLAWHLLTRGEDYAFQRPSLVRRKLRALELHGRRAARQARPERRPGLEHHHRRRREAPRRCRPRPPTAASSPTGRPAGPKVGAGATPERASQRPSKGKAARQATQLLTPALRHVSHPHPHRSIPQGARTRQPKFDFHP